MKNVNQYSVILVDSTSHALRIEKELIKAGFECKLVPVPRILSTDCGVCVRIFRSDKYAALQMLGSVNAAYDRVNDIE
jgi:hypothetical protein